MVVLTDLSDELILAIANAVIHPPDVLSFTCICRRLNKLSSSLLYEQLTLDYKLYQTSPQFTVQTRQLGVAQPYTAVTKLQEQFDNEDKDGKPQISSAVRSLFLRVPLSSALIHHGLGILKN